MNQRLIAACIAVPAVLALVVLAAVEKLPYAYYQPGGTIDVLSADTGSEVIQVDGHEVYPDDGQLRMTTVRVSPAAEEGKDKGSSLTELLSAWVDGDNAVYPYGTVHPDDETPETSQQEGAVQMATSQEDAVYVALTEAGITVPQLLKVAGLSDGSPSDGVLEVDDEILTVGGAPVTDADTLKAAVQKGAAGEPLRIGIERGGVKQTVSVSPKAETFDDGATHLVIGVVPGYDYDFPFDVKINISDSIGGPSAGLIFSLAVYDTITPGSLTGGHEIAGTGEIAPDGTVGPIGGIQQKLAGARDDGADLFIVPEANCADALVADTNGDMRMMMGTTMHDVRVALEAYAEDPDAELPSCEDARSDA